MRQRILLVEDDHLLLQMYEQRLAHDEFEVITATSGEACLHLLEQCTPAAIALDLVMPGLDGFSVLRRLKQEPQWREIPVLVFSNRGAPEDIDTALELGAADYLVKTQSTPTDLVEKIETMLARRVPGLQVGHVRLEINRAAAARSEVLQLEQTLLCPKCRAPMLLDIVMGGTGSREFTGSLVCPNGCTAEESPTPSEVAQKAS
jgi:DNA-binding response OmpR family regulator